jgi:hypothetical protein
MHFACLSDPQGPNGRHEDAPTRDRDLTPVRNQPPMWLMGSGTTEDGEGRERRLRAKTCRMAARSAARWDEIAALTAVSREDILDLLLHAADLGRLHGVQ